MAGVSSPTIGPVWGRGALRSIRKLNYKSTPMPKGIGVPTEAPGKSKSKNQKDGSAML